LDDAMADAGFADRSFPGGRVMRICARSDDATVSQIGRELGITRQGAGKHVADLKERGYVESASSPNDGREKFVRLTARGVAYLEAQRRAVRRIDRQLRQELGAGPFTALRELLDALGGPEQPRLRQYLRPSERMRPGGDDEG
jgi:DNA-binding MarR family transcriptional regulator